MAKEICISSTPHETRLAILEDDQLTEIYYERENEYTLAGSIYKGRVTRVLPGMQSAFVDLGLERDAFLYVTDFMEEQEDSADFEKVPTPNGGGNGRRESQPNREPRAPRAALAVEPTNEPAAVAATPVSPGEGRSDEDEGAQGTRRWRGRRGRRGRGRPQVPREAGATQTSASPDAEADDFTIEVETGPVVYEEAASHGGGQAAYSETPIVHETPAPRYAPPSQPAAPPVIVLPGESLSRYGGKPSAAQSVPVASAAPVASVSSYKPSTLVEVVPGWDGGAELPGETLSRHRSKPAPVAALPATSEIVEHAWELPRKEANSITEEQLPQQAAHPEETIAAHQAEALAEDQPSETPSHASSETAEAPTELGHHEVVEPPVMASEPASATADEPNPEAHFELEHASASYRIDPVAPSEYRFSPVIEEEPEVEIPIEEHSNVAEEVSHTEEVHLPAESIHEELTTTEFAPAQELTLVSHVDAPEEITATDYEEAVNPPAPAQPLHTEEFDPLMEASTASAVIEEQPQVSETELVDDEDDDFAEVPRSFAPGSGTIEEEIIDEEEYESSPLRAFSEDLDVDDLLEEETLENLSGAEISEMVRDAHLEQRIGVSPGGVTEEEESDVEYGEAESDEEDEEEAGEGQTATSSPAPARREGRTDDGRRGQRGGHRRGRPNGGGSGSRRANSQLSDLPIISELLKQGQEILVQIAKEPIAKKGARITSHIALPGRFLVFMPTVNHIGVSRKISSDEERQRLKRILISEKGAASGGFIVRTAADGASEDDLRADIRFLISLWNDIKQRADDGKAPALIYHDLNLIERVLRDQVSANFSTIWVDAEAEYERIVRFLNRFEPSLVRRVKLYTKETPLFEQFGIQEEISKALKSKVWLKSGGSIVINQTEALVAIDINTGKYVGKTARLEDTILKTNLDAIPEIVRQIRLRDLGGIIVIDFIDMDDRRNRHKVMAALEEELKSDRAPSKVLQFNDFGLVAITRKRVKQSLERTLSVQCEVCAGTGMVKSPTTVCNEIYTELRKMQKHLERGDVLLRVNPEVVKTLKSNNARWLNELEEMTGKTIIVKSDPALHPEQFDIQ
jgi:ribonuclease E